MSSHQSTTATAALDQLLEAVRDARSRLSGLHGLVEAAADQDELAATISAAGSIRDDVLAEAAAEAVWLRDAAGSDVVLDITDGPDGLYRRHADLTSQILELQALLRDLADVHAAEDAAPTQDPPDEWGSGDAFAEVYR